MLQAVFSWYNTSSSVECTDEFCSFQYHYELISTPFPYQSRLQRLCISTSVSAATSHWWIGDRLCLEGIELCAVGIFLSAVMLLAIIISFVMLQFDWTIPAFDNVHFIASCCNWWWNILHKLTAIYNTNDWSLS